jgi:hypothetical protein
MYTVSTYSSGQPPTYLIMANPMYTVSTYGSGQPPTYLWPTLRIIYNI